jgi:hypothetical protein
VVGVPARVVGGSAEAQAFIAYGTPCPELPDPIQHAVDDVIRTVHALQARVGELENELDTLRQDGRKNGSVEPLHVKAVNERSA